ncbi:hypothetical protein WOLCODRAFT_147157 [Wolfiporia cocos MD-104 SS10]|uniref:Uncharacterized protein n=1 Tax=Wolfiporia cocos (strain MD-104) TaxID=742152 RepID=A0A2H3J5X9_WOLCO|nr:hypothetical protein WOLCODRAFT_147157 [Wolfiporia cocos MD-104 SS10]
MATGTPSSPSSYLQHRPGVLQHTVTTIWLWAHLMGLVQAGLLVPSPTIAEWARILTGVEGDQHRI